MRRLEKERLRFFRRQRGVSLIETVVALAILGLIGVVLLGGLSTSSRAVMVSQESVIVESLAKSQMEYIKAQDYIPVADYDTENCYEKIDIPDDLAGRGYDIEIITDNETIISSPGVGGFELQSITVVIKCNGEAVSTISVYREGAST